MTAPQPQDADPGGESDGLDSQPPPVVPWFGGLIGLLAGGAAGATCCWLVESRTLMGLATGVGAVVGVLGGAAIEIWQSKRATPESGSPDTATFICTLYACIPAALVLIGGCGGVQKKVTGYLMLGAVFAFPAAGALAGAVLDRLREGRKGVPNS